jgi:flagellar hook-basal body complex protein FliE
MSDLISTTNLMPVRPIGPEQALPVPASAPATGKDFKSYLLDSLSKVNELQSEADAGVQKLLTGQTDNVAEVFSASRKAGIAFDLLMEIRNKLMDAYSEIKQMRV